MSSFVTVILEAIGNQEIPGMCSTLFNVSIRRSPFAGCKQVVEHYYLL